MSTDHPVTTFVDLSKALASVEDYPKPEQPKRSEPPKPLIGSGYVVSGPDWNRIPKLVEFIEVPEEKLTAAILASRRRATLGITWSP